MTILQWIASVAVASVPLAITRTILTGEESAGDLIAAGVLAAFLSFLALCFFWGLFVGWIEPLSRCLGRPRWSHAEIILDPDGISWMDEARTGQGGATEEILWVELPSVPATADEAPPEIREAAVLRT
jgi:hypothetical protein